LKSLSQADPGNVTYTHYIGESYYWTGYYEEKQNELPAALANLQQALASFQRISTADPAEVRARHYIGYCYAHIGAVQSAMGRSTEGMINLHKGLDVAQQMRRADNSGTYVTLPDIVDAYDAIALAYSRDAERPGISHTEKIACWNQARLAYQSSLDTLLEAKRLGASDSLIAPAQRDLVAEIAKCDAKLSESNASAKR
jgi:tetratricopeptide (TPR) repeat protein